MSSGFCSRAAAPSACDTARTARAARRARAARSILAAGAIGSPQLLELSGVGRPELIQAIGAPVVHALPGVGENLQDHLQLRAIFAVEGARTLNVDYQSPFKRAMMGLDYALAPARADDHGAVAARPVHEVVA